MPEAKTRPLDSGETSAGPDGSADGHDRRQGVGRCRGNSRRGDHGLAVVRPRVPGRRATTRRRRGRLAGGRIDASAERRQPGCRMTDLIPRFRGAPVLIVGDLMLDEFVWGTVTRISPEAPVPVVEVRRRSFVAGGAANAGANVA